MRDLPDAADCGARTVTARWALGDFRRERGIPQTMLAVVLLMSGKMIWEIEAGVADPTGSDLARFRQVFGIDPEPVFAISERVPPPKKLVRAKRNARTRRAVTP
jgi:transcriptional regulator with XRE-family HTH domain